VQVLLTALKSNTLPFPSKSSSFLKAILGGDQVSDIRLHVCVCRCPEAQMFFVLRKGHGMPLLVKLGPSFGLAVRWQRQDPYCNLRAMCSGQTLWLVILSAPLCVAA